MRILTTNWLGSGKLFSQGDFNYDTLVNRADLLVLSQHWQQKLAEPAPPLSAMPASLASLPARRAPVRAISLIAS